MSEALTSPAEWKAKCLDRFRAVGVSDDHAHAEIDGWQESYPDYAADEMMSHWSE